jgi:hypothetical protein
METIAMNVNANGIVAVNNGKKKTTRLRFRRP